MNITNDNIPNICANCGKGEESSTNLKACTACKMVKYCNRECQIAHRPQHKKACKKRAAELYDEELFKQPPPEYGDCPICMIRVPSLYTGWRYQTCCGKVICSGCAYAPVYDNEGNVVADTCPFCRTSTPISDAEIVKRNEKRAKAGDAIAIHDLGCNYASGDDGYPQDDTKAFELYQRAGEHGHANAYYSISNAYLRGDGVEVDEKKAIHYWELAAIRGHPIARNNLGISEWKAGKYDRAVKYFMIAARDGNPNSVKHVKLLYEQGLATKEDYSKALESYQAYLDEIKSDQRDKAAAAHVSFKYYE